jgi:hypothetical protein
MRLRTLSLVLAALLAAVPARAQQAAPFPGIAWGVTADSVIGAWGEPASRGPTSTGLDEMNYRDSWNGRPGTRYALVHPALGTIIAGYAVPFGTRRACHGQVKTALLRVARDYPGFVWIDGGPDEALALCDGSRGAGAYGRDPASGTRIGIRLSNASTDLVVDAISTAGFDWVGTK